MMWVWDIDNLVPRVTYVGNDIVMHIHEDLNVGTMFAMSKQALHPEKRLYCRLARLSRPPNPKDVAKTRHIIETLGFSKTSIPIQIIPWGPRIGIVIGEEITAISRAVQQALDTPHFIDPHIYFYKK